MTKLPLKARISLYRQRIILTVRWWFRLPIDEARELQIQSLLEQLARALKTQGGVLLQLQARLHWYETRVPLIRKEYVAFEAKQEKLRKAEQAREAEFKALVESGVSEAEARSRVWPPPVPAPVPAAAPADTATEPATGPADDVVGEIRPEPVERSG